ncbi:M23 family metallopeptidase [Yoonia sp. R2331]|uniref:M23 family metallopeptidase n=1 Tax=Yoonia sp. R2331 TaxID=3237238 RepID=UPI0034E4CFEF
MRHLPALIFCLPLSATAQDITLQMPIACTLDQDCYLQQFVDHDPGADARDFTCGNLSYDGHKGTDFALHDRAALANDVAVLAAAPGTVRGVRDTMPDVLQGSPGAPDVSDRECGNGVVLDHGNGWETQYCHLAQGSMTVSTGDTVTAGQRLGSVGLSGQTQFPHLHLSVRRDGQTVDPFAPDGAMSCDAAPSRTLWQTPLATPPGGLISSGFHTDVPAYEAVKAGLPSPDTLPTDAPALVLWTFIFGGRDGDVITLDITGPDGLVLGHEESLNRTQAQLYRATGLRAPPDGWPTGDYTGLARHMRDGELLDQQEVQLRIVAP